YALAGGATPAAVRATAMGGLALVAAHLGRPTHLWTSLAATGAAMLAWRPELAWDVGFQLSFFGTAAIVLLTPGIERRLRWMPGWLREPFAVTLAAQVGTVPLMASDFHVLSPVAPIANAAVLPLLPAMVGAGLLVAPLAAVPEVGRIAALPSGPGGYVLIDGGSSPARLADELGGRLPPWQRRLAGLVITGPGIGHVGGLVGLAYPAATVLVPEGNPAGSVWRTAALAEA